jgi:hypothetical protein
MSPRALRLSLQGQRLQPRAALPPNSQGGSGFGAVPFSGWGQAPAAPHGDGLQRPKAVPRPTGTPGQPPHQQRPEAAQQQQQHHHHYQQPHRQQAAGHADLAVYGHAAQLQPRQSHAEWHQQQRQQQWGNPRPGHPQQPWGQPWQQPQHSKQQQGSPSSCDNGGTPDGAAAAMMEAWSQTQILAAYVQHMQQLQGTTGGGPSGGGAAAASTGSHGSAVNLGRGLSFEALEALSRGASGGGFLDWGALARQASAALGSPGRWGRDWGRGWRLAGLGLGLGPIKSVRASPATSFALCLLAAVARALKPEPVLKPAARAAPIATQVFRADGHAAPAPLQAVPCTPTAP